MKSLRQKIAQLEGLIGTTDVTDWEDGFLRSLIDRTARGEHTAELTEKQLDVIERIYGKHFA